MVGDGMSDYKAAQAAGVGFLARELGREFDGLDLVKFPDMTGVLAWLDSPAAG